MGRKYFKVPFPNFRESKVFKFTPKVEKLLKENQTLILGETVPEYALMPFSKYASLVGEGDKEKISLRLKIEKV